ncbi:MAG: LTA synthase family protein [Eubacteriales bacterium]|nr:LTA synthase family protein [Eubacteriales bacterium]
MHHFHEARPGAHQAEHRRPGAKEKKHGLVRYAAGWNLPLAVLLSLGVWFLCLKTAPVIPSTFFTTPLLGLLNWLPVLLVLLALLSAFGNVFSAAAATLAVCGLLNFANRLKIDARDDPLVPQDLSMAREAVQAAGSYDLHVDTPLVLLCVIVLLALVVCAMLFRTRRTGLRGAFRAAARAGGCLGCAGLLVLLTYTVYASADVFASFPVTNRFNMTTVYEQAGFHFSFLRNVTQNNLQKPEGFSKTETEARIAATETVPAAPKPVNVIFVMSEAFCDLSDDDDFTWTAETDPLKNYHALQRSENAISGHLIVPNYGGGTANTEFDVLTGMQTALLSDAGVSSFRVLHKNVDSVFRVAVQNGWQTQFIHPGKAWFYNRQNIYKWLGAQEIVFEDAFEGAAYKGGYVTDAALLDYMTDNFERHAANGQPQFTYVTTIQNHMAYTEQKYGPAVDLTPISVKGELPDEARIMLTEYLYGLRDADDMLGAMTDYFAKRDEPVLLVFFGDHLPSMGEDYLCYRALGMEMTDDRTREDWLDAYAPPFLLWANEAGAEALDFGTLAARLGLPENGKLSASFLGAAVLDAVGCGESDPFFRFVNTLRRELPVVQRGTAVDADGAYHAQTPAESADAVAEYKDRIYYRMKYENLD